MATRVGPYELKQTLGTGSFGKVKRAIDSNTGKEYAIKIMDKGNLKEQELMGNVKREIKIMKALNHRNIVNLREVLSSKSKLYIVMDLVRGGELFEMIEKQGELNEKIARKYFQQLVDGVEYCHRRGIYHRDLKPENLLVSEDGTLKITDFGVSSMKSGTEGSELLYTSCGTPYYAAPELLSKAQQGYSGVKVDVWSVGIILYLLLTGTLPFQDEDMNTLYKIIQEKEPDYPPEIPPEAKNLLKAMLHKDPQKRIDLTQVKQDPWFLTDYVPPGEDHEKLGAKIFAKRRESHTVTGAKSTSKLPPTGSRERLNINERKPSGDLIESSSEVFQIGERRTSEATSIFSSESSSVLPISGLNVASPKKLTTQFEGKSLEEFVKAVLVGKPDKKIDEVVHKLESIDIDCVDDMQVVADTMSTPEKFTNWLKENASFPDVTSMRFAEMFFEKS